MFRQTALVALALWGWSAAVPSALAQQNPPNNNPGGILIDPSGVIRPAEAKRESAAVSKKRREAFAKERMPAGIVEASELRVVSLVEVEEKIAAIHAAGKPVPPALEYLSGLTRIDYVFVDEENKDVCLAGPAEGFGPDPSGTMVGLESGRPAVSWSDLVVAFRAVKSGERTMGCSIDPVPDNMAKLQDFLRQNNTPALANAAHQRFEEMARILGMQDVRVWGVPPETHFGQVMVAADFRLKRLALGFEPAGVRGFKSNLALTAPGANAIQRWWFSPLYEPVEMSPDKLAFHLQGQRLQVLSQDQISDVEGNRRDAPFKRKSTEAFSKQFTDLIPELAREHLVFAELQNLFDLAVVATLCQEYRLAQRAGWSMETLLDPTRMPVATGNAPKSMPSAYTSRKAGRAIVALIGGVTMLPDGVAQSARPAEGMSAKLTLLRSERAKRPRPE